MSPTLIKLLSSSIRQLVLVAVLLWAVIPMGWSRAQSTPDCGIVDEIIFPMEDTIRRGDDFGMYRNKFGGLHTAVDVAFYRYGDPVYAIAKGRVTYADTEGWDTEKGVVIIEHTFPDGQIYYSLYGHMESFGDTFFPAVNQCVEPGSVIGAVGDPSLSAPHLHFEIRTFGPDDGGPGYWDTNPLEAGWLHPLDFIRLWQARLFNGAESPYRQHLTALNAPAVPPLVPVSGGLITASSNLLEGLGPDGSLVWRMELSSTITGIAALPDGRTLARTADNTVMLLQNGRYDAVWLPEEQLTGEPILLGDVVVFITEDNALAAYTPQGERQWMTDPLGDRISSSATAGDRLAVSVRSNISEQAPSLFIINSTGEIVYEDELRRTPIMAPAPEDSLIVLDGRELLQIGMDYGAEVVTQLPFAPGGSTALMTDAEGNIYVFMALDESVLYAYDAAGTLRWQVVLPGTHRQPPLLAVGDSCLLYALSAEGSLYAINTASGTLAGQTQLYAGGSKGHPNARLLEVLPEEQIRFGAGFLSVMTVDGYTLAGIQPDTCTPLE